MKYLHALETAITYIEAHLNENIGLGDVARETGYSYYHMTRLFKSAVGETDKTTYTESGDAIYSEMIGTEIDSFEGIPDSVVKKTVKPGKYAVFTHSGSLYNIEKTYDYIWGTWILSTKEELDNREDFELYTEQFHGADNPDNKTEIYIPIC